MRTRHTPLPCDPVYNYDATLFPPISVSPVQQLPSVLLVTRSTSTLSGTRSDPTSTRQHAVSEQARGTETKTALICVNTTLL